MLKEIAHFARHAPAALMMMGRMDPPDCYHALMLRWEAAGLAERRRDLVADLTGDVLEIGCGTGMMFQHYPAQVVLQAVEPDDAFRVSAEARGEKAAAEVVLHAGRAEKLPFADDSFDAVVAALVLCSVGSVDQVLAELLRVLRPAGTLRFLEHVRSEGAVAGAMMDVANPLWLLLNRQGCHMNRRLDPALREAGLTVLESERFQVFAPGLPAFPLRSLKARAEV